MRILCLGIGTEKNKEYRYVSVDSYIPTIYDYDFVIFNLVKYSNSFYASLANRRAEFDKFFQNNGICIVISDVYDKWDVHSNYDWCPFSNKFEVKNTSGETIVCTGKRSRFIFESIKFVWTHFFTKIEINHNVLATNRD